MCGDESAKTTPKSQRIFQVFWLVVTIFQASKHTEHLEMALNRRPRQSLPELIHAILDRQADASRPLPVSGRPGAHALFGPFTRGGPDQRGDVIGNWSVHCILQIEHAGLRLADHQVPGRVIAMNVTSRLREIVRNNEVEDLP